MNPGLVFFLILFIKKATFLEVNLSMTNSTSQSKTIAENYSDMAIDGDIHSCAISERSENELAWWSVKLDKDYNIERILINYNSRSEFSKYMNHLKIFVSKNVQNPEENICISYKGKKQETARFIILNCVKPSLGNLVTIKRFGGLFKNWLVLCEVLILADIEIISFNKPTTQSGILFKKMSGLAVDGDKESCATVMSVRGEFPWWRVLLDEDRFIDKVMIYFRPNSTDVHTLNYFNVYVSNDNTHFEKDECGGYNSTGESIKINGVIDLKCKEPKPKGRYVTIKKFGGTTPHHLQGLCEIEVHSKEFSKFNQFSQSSCKSDETRCEPLYTCLPKEKNCDRVRNCPTGIDELPCPCLPHQYKCRTGHCMPRDWLCDGVVDCPYGEDEQNSCECSQGMFKCVKRQKCLNNERRCDGVADCPDYSDEEGCFSLKDDYLKVIYKDTPDFYVCSTNWIIAYSRDVCQYLSNSLLVASNFVEPVTKQSRFLTLNQVKSFIKNFPSLDSFSESTACSTNKVVQIECSKGTGTEICGKRGLPDKEFGSYIINGNVAMGGAWPWHVQIYIEGDYVCGGSLIRTNWVLTAAHCIAKANPLNVIIKVGAILFPDHFSATYKVSHIINHPEYARINNDITLVRLVKPVQITNFVKPICLPNGILDSDIEKSYKYCILTGFGVIDRESTNTRYLMQGRMNLMSDEECAENLAGITESKASNFKDTITQKKLICAGSAPTLYGINSCQGDSGSPLVCNDDRSVWTQVGIVSLSFNAKNISDCTNTIFTRVNRHIDFIYRVLQRENEFQLETAGTLRLKSILVIPMLAILYCKLMKAQLARCSKTSV